MSKIEVRIPAALRTYSGGRDRIRLEAASVGAALEGLDPGLRWSVCDEQGRIRPYVNLFLNDENVRDLAGLDSPTADGDVLHIIPAVSGG